MGADIKDRAVVDEQFLRRWALVRLKRIGGCGDTNPQIANSLRRPLTEEEIQQEMDKLRLLSAQR